MTDFFIKHGRYNRYKAEVDAYLFNRLPVFLTKGQDKLASAMRYSSEAGGKRIRPVMALAVCDLLGGDRELVLPFACAIEMIHTYSLIHDDLPCMDDDALRRGKPTCHKEFGEDIALLAGDALLNLAFETVLHKIAEIPDLETQADAVRAAACIAEASGAAGMAGGQAIDLQGEIETIEQLQHLHFLKTGKMIIAPVLVAAILSRAKKVDYDRLYEYAKGIGLAFQIKDDILDVYGDSKMLGKDTGRDEKNKKTTFVRLLGLEGTQKLLFETQQNAMRHLMEIDGFSADVNANMNVAADADASHDTDTGADAGRTHRDFLIALSNFIVDRDT